MYVVIEQRKKLKIIIKYYFILTGNYVKPFKEIYKF